MYTVRKKLIISASHKLKLSYESKCENLHGHNWEIELYFRSKQLNKDGMVIDFAHVKREIMDQFDHKNLNDVLSINPTAENLARYFVSMFPEICYRADVTESPNNTASYERD